MDSNERVKGIVKLGLQSISEIELRSAGDILNYASFPEVEAPTIPKIKKRLKSLANEVLTEFKNDNQLELLNLAKSGFHVTSEFRVTQLGDAEAVIFRWIIKQTKIEDESEAE